LNELMIRFVVGGFVVSAFSLISDLFKPKTFAGLFGAVPSVALASLALTVFKMGKHAAAIEARSMIIGSVAFLIYARTVSYILLRFRAAAMPASLALLVLWFAAATGLWYAVLGS
jgi:Protein of unknown function (DUF3147)